ncbi:hypothetical protein NIES4071_12390 [Calothrix sp. NIES-4071]|nr:hypothetical protein NIES4071_12390 [Calothrix sp. NIES-4071]BAZ55579.1 hypothetical protein NIES4105_12350 [Calothrix sp. NIES-4105]
MISTKPFLSVVTPTLGKFSKYWLERLLSVHNSVQFVLVYPPDVKPENINDPRVKIIISSFKGELIQRLIGLLNADGEYILALDDDDFVHPDVVNLIGDYFKIFPESWMLRLNVECINSSDETKIKRDWDDIPNIELFDLSCKNTDKSYNDKTNQYERLLEMPITPLNKKFDIRYAISPSIDRKDMHGRHPENFNNRVWKAEIVQKALPEFIQSMKVFEMKMLGALVTIPSWNLDRSLSLFIQAKFYTPDQVVGHWMPSPGQIRFIQKPVETKEPRILLAADTLVVKRFPQYGYLWNLFFHQLYSLPKTFAKAIRMNINKLLPVK